MPELHDDLKGLKWIQRGAAGSASADMDASKGLRNAGISGLWNQLGLEYAIYPIHRIYSYDHNHMSPSLLLSINFYPYFQKRSVLPIADHAFRLIADPYIS